MTLPAHIRVPFAARMRPFAAASFVAAAMGCSSPSGDDKFVITPPPGPPTFNAVSTVLELHCGTLNCHGNTARNMRFFGFYGVRLDPRDKTGFAVTTDAEYLANFESIISIEPERLSQIVRSGGANASKWVVLSKGRGDEHHKGGARLVRGEAADTCLVSWISARPGGPPLSAEACDAASTLEPPGDDWSQ
jgi:hypothetical protein